MNSWRPEYTFKPDMQFTSGALAGLGKANQRGILMIVQRSAELSASASGSNRVTQKHVDRAIETWSGMTRKEWLEAMDKAANSQTYPYKKGTPARSNE